MSHGTVTIAHHPQIFDWPKHAREAGFVGERGPVSAERLRAVDVSDGFIAYLRRFKLVAD